MADANNQIPNDEPIKLFKLFYEKDLNQTDVELFLKAVEEQDGNIPVCRIYSLTFNKLFNLVSMAAAAAGCDTSDLMIDKEFDVFGMLAIIRRSEKLGLGIDLDSEKDFTSYILQMLPYGDYAWRMLLGPNEQSIIIRPIWNEFGYYISLGVSGRWNRYTLVKTFLTFKENMAYRFFFVTQMRLHSR